MHIRQTEAPPLKLVKQLLVVNAHQVHQSRMKIMHMHRVFDNVVTEIIGFAKAESRFDSRTRHPHRETTRMVIPPVIVGGKNTLRVHRTAKFTTPDHQRILQHAPAFEVGDESCRRLIDGLALLLHAARQTAVVIPALVVQLYELNIFFQ